MIKLDAASQTTYVSTRNGKTVTETVDTLRVRYVELNLTDGGILAIIERGTVIDVPAIPATEQAPEVPATTKFQSIDTDLWVSVSADGTYASRDGSWKGMVSTGPQILQGLKQAFDGFLLASGAVTGTII